MTHIPEQYKKAEEIDMNQTLGVLRAHIGELPDLRQPTEEEAREAVEQCFPQLLENEKCKVVDAFLRTEAEAYSQADISST